MKQATNKTNITTFNRGIATLLLISQLLTSCGFNETLVVPSKSAPASMQKEYDESLQGDHTPQGFGSTDSDETFAFDTTTIAGAQLTFTHTTEAGLQVTYFPSGNNTQPTPITHTPSSQPPTAHRNPSANSHPQKRCYSPAKASGK